jgi:hypothetical protein
MMSSDIVKQLRFLFVVCTFIIQSVATRESLFHGLV